MVRPFLPMRHHLPRLIAAAAIAIGLTATTVLAQRGRWRLAVEPNIPYDGRFTFVRLRYDIVTRSGWEFDYPAMERNFMSVLGDLTTMQPHIRHSNVLDLDDPELFKYPVAYLSEPGYWYPTEAQAASLRAWLLKGGFLIVDDFYGRQWQVFEQAMRRVLPGGRIVPLDATHPVFDSFFGIATLEGMHHPASQAYPAEYLGVFEDNDPAGRLMVIINYNNDIGDYMEWTGAGWYPVNLTNDAYKFATNYLIYALSR